MSEKSPFTNQLNNFDQDKVKYEARQQRQKAKEEAKAWTEDLTTHREGEVEVETFSPEHKQQLEEADAYYKHMKQMADRPTDHYEPWDNSSEAIQWRQAMYERDTENNDRAFNQEWDDAIAENQAYDATKQAETDALEAKFSENAKLRQMDNISKELHDLRKSEIDPDTIDAVERRIDELDGRLQELLVNYSESDDYDLAVADMLMDREDSAALQKAKENALRERAIITAQQDVEGALEPGASDDESQVTPASPSVVPAEPGKKSEKEEGFWKKTRKKVGKLLQAGHIVPGPNTKAVGKFAKQGGGWTKKQWNRFRGRDATDDTNK